MPTYQYKCDACGHPFEIRQSITEGKLKKCPQCNKMALHRLIGTGSGLIFKGSGFYATDYKNKGSGASGCPAADPKSSACCGCPSKKAA